MGKRDPLAIGEITDDGKIAGTQVDAWAVIEAIKENWNDLTFAAWVETRGLHAIDVVACRAWQQGRASMAEQYGQMDKQRAARKAAKRRRKLERLKAEMDMLGELGADE
jgi:hypothetical protein